MEYSGAPLLSATRLFGVHPPIQMVSEHLNGNHVLPLCHFPRIHSRHRLPHHQTVVFRRNVGAGHVYFVGAAVEEFGTTRELLRLAVALYGTAVVGNDVFCGVLSPPSQLFLRLTTFAYSVLLLLYLCEKRNG